MDVLPHKVLQLPHTEGARVRFRQREQHVSACDVVGVGRCRGRCAGCLRGEGQGVEGSVTNQLQLTSPTRVSACDAIRVTEGRGVDTRPAPAWRGE